MSTKQKPICTTCKGEHIKVDSYSTWNVDLQQWEHASDHDNHVCEDCGGECSVEWVEVEAKARGLTLETFRASRHFCPDMRLAVGDISDPYFDEDEPCPAYIYEGQLVIDIDPYGGLPSMTIGNDSHSGELSELEKELFEYGVREGIFSLESGS